MTADFELTAVAENLGFPEGPVAMADGSLLFVEIQKQRVSRLPKGGKQPEVVAEIKGGGPNGLAIGPDGAVYICDNGGVYSFSKKQLPNGAEITVPAPPEHEYWGGSIWRLDLPSGAITRLYHECDGEPLLAPDDIVFDKDGNFWFTTTGYQKGNLLHKGGLYYATPDGKRIVKAATIPMANGVGLSPGGETVYVSDTIFGRLWALQIDGCKPGNVKPGLLPEVMPGGIVQVLPSFQMIPGEASPYAGGIQWLDSLAVEASGRVCVGTIFNGGITVFSPDGATSHVPVPDLFTTNLCFGGADMCDVWITASSTGRIYKARWPRPGLKLAFNR